MMHPGVDSSRVDEMCHAHLLNMPQPLKPWMRYNFHYLRLGKTQKAVDGVVDDFNLQKKAVAVTVCYARGGLPDFR